jgi:hypothetical protein
MKSILVVILAAGFSNQSLATPNTDPKALCERFLSLLKDEPEMAFLDLAVKIHTAIVRIPGDYQHPVPLMKKHFYQALSESGISLLDIVDVQGARIGLTDPPQYRFVIQTKTGERNLAFSVPREVLQEEPQPAQPPVRSGNTPPPSAEELEKVMKMIEAALSPVAERYSENLEALYDVFVRKAIHIGALPTEIVHIEYLGSTKSIPRQHRFKLTMKPTSQTSPVIIMDVYVGEQIPRPRP